MNENSNKEQRVFLLIIEVVFVLENHFKQSKRQITKKKYKGICILK